MEYTVEVTTKPVENDDWSRLRNVTDVVPGTLLLEDPDEPMLIIPVEADAPGDAFRFVDGLATLLGLTLEMGRAYPAPDEDFEDTEIEAGAANSEESDVVKTLERFVSETPTLNARMSHDGRRVLTNS